jgi:hypothetical protein
LHTRDYKEAQMAAKTSFDFGIEKGRILVLMDLLEERFGFLGETAKARLEAMTAGQLKELGRRLLRPEATLDSLGLAEPTS